MLWLIKKIKPNHKVYEYEVVYGIWILELIIVIIGIIMFNFGIFM
jgi:hypothetical protein